MKPAEQNSSAGAMRPETPETSGRLRTGLTTGVCATAAAVAGARWLLEGWLLETVEVVLPKGQVVSLALNDLEPTSGGAVAGVIKDAGDDPDATHGARVWVEVTLCGEPGVEFVAGAGVGTVTRPGLVLEPGEAAINPVPRRMIQGHLETFAAAAGYSGGFRVTVGVDGGERIAGRTMNARLGILGGLSILGTTGIVRPFSCAAYIASIHQAIDVARANGCPRVACCTGGTSEAAMREQYGLDDMALIEMGDLFGAALKYLRRHPLPAVVLAAGFGKLSKFAAGHLDAHSRKSRIDLDALAEEAADLGGSQALVARIRAANTSAQALADCLEQGVELADRISARAWRRARGMLPETTALEVCAVDRAGRIVGFADGAGGLAP